MSALSSLVDLWLKQIEAAAKAKHRDFDRQADECWKYYAKDYDDIYVRTDRTDGFPTSVYKLRLAKAREFVSLMVPRCHQKVPNRLVSPSIHRLPPNLAQFMPEATQWQEQVAIGDGFRSSIMQWLLNYLPNECGLNRETRIVLPEAFVKGRAITWTEAVESAAGIIPATCAESTDNLLCDPDAIQFRDCAYIVRIRHRSAYRIAEDFRQFGITAEMLRSQSSSQWLEAARSNNQYRVKDLSTDEPGDVVTYFEVYSRIGAGSIFRDSPKEIQPVVDAIDSLDGACWLAICPGVNRPLNLSPEMLERAQFDPAAGDDIKAALSWPIAFYKDFASPWPCQNLDFLPNSDNPWSTSPMWGGIPMLRYIDGAYNMLFERIVRTCRDLIVTSQALEPAISKAIHGGLDQEVIASNGKPGEDIPKLIHTIQFQPMKAEFFEAIRMASQEFERFTGMTPLLSGAEDARQVRVAADIEARERNVSTRPQDYADAVEEWMGRQARAEAIAARLIIEPAVISRMAREPAPEEPGAMPKGGWGPITMAWLKYLATDDPAVACAEFEYTIEAGSGRRKNQAKTMADATQIMQVMFAPGLELAQTGKPEIHNALMALLGEGLDRDMTDFMLSPPEQQGAPPPDPEQEAKAQAAQQQTEMDAQRGQQEMAMQADQQERDAGLQTQQAEQEMAMREQEMMQRQVEHEQQTRHSEEKHRNDVQAKQAQAKAQKRQQRGKPKGQ